MTSIATHATIPASPLGQVRLTRRGRVVVVLAALVLALVVGIALSGVSSASEEAGAARATEVVVVNEGDTLWGIAAEVAEDGEVRSMITEIRELNDLDSSVVTLGQKIHVPVAG
ncbi:LysM peptidoglycan-binding domain-containing protein [Nocardioides jishulii]|nr:LysM peptidoglycan-binding domain-containing protein [Nocardioides jishulii]